MRRKSANGFYIAFVMLIIICGVAVGVLYYRNRGNTEKMPLDKYFEIDKYNENSIPLLADTTLLENKAYEIDGTIYIEQSVISTMLDSKVYWDNKNTSVIIATPNQIITIPTDKNVCYIDGKTTKLDKVALKKVADKEYAISLEFLKLYVNVEYEVYDNPRRVALKCGWGESFTKVKTTSEDVLRVDSDRKSEILKELKKGETLYVLTENFQSYMRYIQVMTQDGIVGYVRNKKIGKPYEEVLANDYKGLNYTPIHMKSKVNLGWLQVSNMAANNGLKTLVNATSGVNVVSPTWYTLSDTKGNITSYASKDFVTYAHAKGIKVWALVDDFSEIKLLDVISDTESRGNFITNLVYNTIQCGADGINVDFEHITEESSVHYIQFLRELRIKCHKYKLVLSVDSYVPLSYNAHYNIDVQNEFVDYVVIMAYDEFHSKSEESGSVASISYTQTAIEKALEKVDKEKLIIAVPFYTRLWGEQGGAIVSCETLGMKDAKQKVATQGGKFTWDDTTKQYYAEYDYQGKTYKIWLENGKSISEKVNLISQADVAGIGAWRIGYETPDVWKVIKAALNK